MGARILSLLAVLFLVTGCTGNDENTTALDGSLTPRQEVTSQGAGVDASAQGGVQAGTQQDLVVNVGDRVFFGYDQYDLTTEARATTERLAQWLKTNANVNLMIEGHADERGTREYNLALGEKRATAVRNYLIANGVQPDRLQTISYGKERPAVTGSDESAWAQNRRSVFVVQ